jgi:hypothetical protein
LGLLVLVVLVVLVLVQRLAQLDQQVLLEQQVELDIEDLQEL